MKKTIGEIAMEERRFLWFTVNTIPNYELKLSRDLAAIRDNRNLDEVQEVFIPLVSHTTTRRNKYGEVTSQKEVMKPKFTQYFFVKLEVNYDNQPSGSIWHTIRNMPGCIGPLNNDKYMLGMTDEELSRQLNIPLSEILEASI